MNSTAYILPTRDRPDILAQTLATLGALPKHNAQVIVLDNDSATPPLPHQCPRMLANGLPVELVKLRQNLGASARNIGVRASDPACRWVVLLDDDSAPMDLGHLAAMRSAGAKTSAIAAEIFLQDPTGPIDPSRPLRESGGLPEVFIGCGVAVRRDAFIDLDGYDHRFNYYAEEYDLAARMMLAGGSIKLDRRFRVHHRKVSTGRDMNTILHRLVRNNGWVAQRYAPARFRVGELDHLITRYGQIAKKESATAGYDRGLSELLGTLRRQRRAPMSRELWDRFTGRAVARESLRRAHERIRFSTASIIAPGKNAHVIIEELNRLGVRVIEDASTADVLVPGTLSPGPLLDAMDARRDQRVVSPWDGLTQVMESRLAERAA